MKLLVSPVNITEALAAVNGGADIIDVKNPREGSLGANFPWVIKSVKEAIGDASLSATIGDFNFKPGTASLAALGAAAAGAEYIKVGLYDIRTEEQAAELLRGVVRAVKEHDPAKKVVAAGYSDYGRIGSISPLDLPPLCSDAGADIVMMDTGIKDGRSTFEFLSEKELKGFVSAAHRHGLLTALAGTIKFQDAPALKRISPDIVGVRGCVCGGDRNTSIRQELVRELKRALTG